MSRYRLTWLAGSLATVATLAGCVERTMKISTDPEGARVIINDEEAGISPTKVSFLWYGDYEIILRKRGYETYKTHYRIDPPWYQIPPIDLVAETMIPTTIHDDHTLPTYKLKPVEPPPTEELVERAVELRNRALYESAER